MFWLCWFTQNTSLKLHLLENVQFHVWFILFFLPDGPTLELFDFLSFFIHIQDSIPPREKRHPTH